MPQGLTKEDKLAVASLLKKPLDHAKTATGQNQSADKHYGRDSR